MVHGALFVREPAIDPMRKAVLNRIKEHGLPDELKWTTTSRRRLDRDLQAVDCFFSIYETYEKRSAPRFQCIVIDQHKLNIRSYHNGDWDMCFYKLLYPLLVRRIASYAAPEEDVHIILDHRNTKKYDLLEFRDVLANGVRKQRPKSAPRVRSVQYRDSKEEPLLQIADYLTGAVCFHQNNRHLLKNASTAKIAASSKIALQLGENDLCMKNRRDERFGIWTINLK